MVRVKDCMKGEQGYLNRDKVERLNNPMRGAGELVSYVRYVRLEMMKESGWDLNHNPIF